MSIAFGVITWIPDPFNDSRATGNLCSPLLYVQIEERKPEAVKPCISFLPDFGPLYVENFSLGEILVMDTTTGREIGGDGRKPSKWDVTCEEFTDVREAVARAREVTTGKPRLT